MNKRVILLFLVMISTVLTAQTNHTGTISTNETWTAAGNPHIVTGNITISSASLPILTIEPGVIVKFDAATTMTVGHSSSSAFAGGLMAVGTEADPIVFTSNVGTPAPGDWDNIRFYTFCIDAQSRIEYAVMEYGGLASPYAVLTIQSTPVVVDNVTFRNNSDYGVYIYGQPSDGARPSVSNCTFTDNGGYPIRLSANDGFILGAGNTFSGNTPDKIYIDAVSINYDQTWINPGIPYFIDDSITLQDDGGGVSWSIQYGAELQFAAGERLTIGHTSAGTYTGTLTATGVTFAGAEDTPGYWVGLYFNNYAVGGTLSGCTIKNAGYGASTPESIMITTSSTMEQQVITGCTITGGAGDGIYIADDARPTLSGNTITDHAEFPISVDVNDTGFIGPNNNLTGNGDDRIELRTGSITQSQTWSNHGVPYVCTDDILLYDDDHPILQISPGVEIQLHSDSYILIGHSSASTYIGGLIADGVTFTRAGAGEIHRGLLFNRYADDANCVLTDCIVEYGGANDTSNNAGITITRSAPTLEHVTFRNNAGEGLRINDIPEGSSIPQVNNCRFYDNTGYAARAFASELSAFGLNNVYEGNTINRIYVVGDAVAYDTRWMNQGLPYEVDGSITVMGTSSPHLIIDSGIELLFSGGDYMGIGHSSATTYKGSIDAEGVIFRGMTGTPGEWAGLRIYRFNNEGMNELNKCIIDGATTNLYTHYSSPIISQTVIRNASVNGIRTYASASSPTIYKCHIYNNDTGILCDSYSNPTVGGSMGNANSIFDNTSYGINNSGTTTLIDATFNWWGEATGPYHSSNPGGDGNAVSDNVDFANYLTTSPANAPSLFDLLTPASGSVIDAYDTLLDWETSIDPTPSDEVRYKLELSISDQWLPQHITTIDDISGSSYLLSDALIDDDTRYWWRVTAYDLTGFETTCNQLDFYFDVFVPDAPNAFALLSPTNGSTAMTTSIEALWETATDNDPGDSVYYTAFLDETASFTDPDSVQVNDTGLYTPFCTPGNIYYWTVKATDSYGKTTYSDVGSFYVDLSAGPRQPLWVELAQDGNNCLLTWEEVPGADGYIVEHSAEPYGTFGLLDSAVSTTYTHINAGLNYPMSFYQVKAVDNDRILYWRNLRGERLRN
jgi:parallel beta-helix repeat protein